MRRKLDTIIAHSKKLTKDLEASITNPIGGELEPRPGYGQFKCVGCLGVFLKKEIFLNETFGKVCSKECYDVAKPF